MKQLPVLTAGGLVFAAVWLSSPELPWPARAVTGILLGPLPAATILQAHMVAQFTEDELPPRMSLYAGTMLALWGVAFATALAASESHIRPELLGVALLPWSELAIWTLFSLVAMGALVLAFKALGIKESPVLRHLIPQTLKEKITFAGVSITAGICEELVFRGFLIATLSVATGSLILATLIAAAAFGAAHAHQHVMGGLRAALLGLVLSVPLLVTGSLYPGIAAHAIVDLAGGIWLAKWLLRS